MGSLSPSSGGALCKMSCEEEEGENCRCSVSCGKATKCSALHKLAEEVKQSKRPLWLGKCPVQKHVASMPANARYVALRLAYQSAIMDEAQLIFETSC